MEDSPPGRSVDVDGTRLHVDERGASDAPPLLYLHGGPGQGCFDFMACQGDRLAKDLRVIGVDQRGALFSDPLPAGASLTEDQLVDDFEALREALGIERWAILGHSFGARLALRYAAQHSDTVTTAIFDCPPWDHAYGMPYMLELAQPMLVELGQIEAVEEAQAIIADPPALDHATWQRRTAVLDALGDRRDELYIKRTDLIAQPGGPFPSAAVDETYHERGSRHSEAVAKSASFAESLLPLLSDVGQPALLIRGESDPVTSPAEIARFRADVAHGRVEVFEASAHFAQLEEPERYADTVRAFVAGERPQPT
ncbi:MAG: alpha/beta fold hydrolase [Nocardioidaceae bacterium]